MRVFDARIRFVPNRMEAIAIAIRRSQDEALVKLRRDLPHQEIVDAIIFVPEQVADCGYLSPRSVGEIRFPVRWEVTGCFRDHFDAPLDGPPSFVVVRIALESKTICNIRHGIYRFKNVKQTNSRGLHLENSDCFAFDSILESRMQRTTRGKISRPPERLREAFA